MKALLLAAGSGQRLRQVSGEIPKGLITVADKTIFDRALETLASEGVHEIVVVTGFQKEAYVSAASKAMKNNGLRFRLVHNLMWNDFGNWYSALLGLRVSDNEDVLLINSDLVFQRAILSRLLHRTQLHTTLVIDSSSRLDGETMKVEVKNGWICGITKKLALERCAGEYIGLTYINKSDLPAIREALADLRRSNPSAYYEDALNNICARLRLEILDIAGLLWAEVDTPVDLMQAKALFSGEGDQLR